MNRLRYGKDNKAPVATFPAPLRGEEGSAHRALIAVVLKGRHPTRARIVQAATLTLLLNGTVAALDAPQAELEEGRRLLADVRDFVFSFDDPGFYWFCRFVADGKAAGLLNAAQPPSGQDGATADAPQDWTQMMERPSDYRGRIVVVEGFLQRVSAFDVPNRRQVGRLYQCELSQRDSRGFCTLVCVNDPGDVPLHSRVRAAGFFIKARRYRSSDGDEGAGPLIVASSLMMIDASPVEAGGGNEGVNRTIRYGLFVGVAGLALMWWYLRGALRRGRDRTPPRGPGRDWAPAVSRIRPDQEPIEDEGDFAWLEDADRDGPSSSGCENHG